MERTRVASCLSEYGYDMVVATTQKSINATLKRYLYGMDSTPYTQYYSYEDQEISEEKVLEATNGVDLFSITDPSAYEEAINNAFQLGVGTAFRATMGISTKMSPAQIEQIVTLIPTVSGNVANVKYKAFYQSFEIITLDYDRRTGKPTFLHISQDDSNPWTFTYNVCLDFGDDTFSKLPPDVQAELKRVNPQTGTIDPDDIFSIQQLFLDFNTATLESSPKIEGDIDSKTMVLLQTIFVENYFKKLKEQNGTVLGYTVKKKENYSYGEALLKPTDFKFDISPYLNEEGNIDDKNQDYSTLNYLVMAENRSFPIPEKYPKVASGFNWNWVTNDGGAQSQVHGCMSINKNIILDLLQKN